MTRKNNDPSPDHRVENDPVWGLLAQSPPPKAGPMFARNVVRAARLAAPEGWRGWFARNPATGRRRIVPILGGITAAAAALTIAILSWQQRDEDPRLGGKDPGPQAPAQTETFGELEELAQEELLLAAADDFSQFSDDELIALLGF